MNLLSDNECFKIDNKLKVIFCIILLWFSYRHFFWFDNTVLKDVEMKPFSEPIQETLVDGQMFQNSIYSGKVYITPLAKYKIYGRVLQEHYRPQKLQGAAMYPYDVSIGYGPFKHKEAYDAVKVRMASTISYMDFSASAWEKHLSKYFDTKSISHYFTNNHLCPANKRVKKGISKLRKKDIVYIEGYLIKYTLMKNNGNIEKGYSSTSRDDNYRGDNGNGSCEQIYVTRIVTRHGDYR